MKSSQKKICILFCGNVFGLSEKDMSGWLDQMPELGVIADIDPVFVFGEQTANIQSGVWTNLAEAIYKKYNTYDGFVVIHNVDNLLFTGSAISFMLQNLSKPIIFTSGQIGEDKASFKKSGIKANLINACKAATEDLAEVAIMFGNRLLRANQASLGDSHSLNAFEAPESGLLGQIDFSLRIFGRANRRNNNRMDFLKNINDNIELTEDIPLLSRSVSTGTKDAKDGFFIRTDNTFLPQETKESLENISKNVPVVVFSDRSMIKPEKTKLIFVSDITFVSALTKFVWALGQSKDKSQIKKLMNKDIAGEIIN